jgi:hypothetical protein
MERMEADLAFAVAMVSRSFAGGSMSPGERARWLALGARYLAGPVVERGDEPYPGEPVEWEAAA